MNGKSSMVSALPPFALSPSKPVLSPVAGGKWRFPLFPLVFLFFWPQSSLAFAQVGGIPRIKPPPLVRIIGAFAPVSDTQRSNLQTLSVQVKGQKWKMRIREIKALTATTTSGWGLLKALFPPYLRLAGSDEFLAPLQQHDIAGKPFILEGRLYVGDHMLYVTAVTVNEP
jgi:hypothetical protein